MGLPVWIEAGLALLVLLVFSYIHIRHIAVAAVAAFGPLPGYLLGVALHIPTEPLCYLVGFIASGVFLSVVETQICDGMSPADATKRSLRDTGAIVISLLALAIFAAAIFSALSATQYAPSLLALLSGISALGVAVPAARYIPFDDEFIVRANRLRERRERWLDRLAFVVQPRWGWSVSGIALIFAILGYFGNSGPKPYPALVWAAEALLFVIVSSVSIRNVRRVLAFLMTASALSLLAVWVGERFPWERSEIVLAIAMAAMPALVTAIQSAGLERSGDTAVVASLRASERYSIPLAFWCLASAVSLLALGAFAAAILVFLGGAAAMVAFPAITTAIYDLFPRRVSLDAYRIR